MKRCIICGNTGDDNSAVCSVCGNPYVDMSDSFEEDFEETGKEPEEASKEPAQEEKSEEPAGQSAKRSPRPHGMTAGPHIYGQEDGPYSQGGTASAPEAGEPQEQPPLQQAEGQLVRRQTARKAAARGPQGEAPAQQPGAGRPAPARSMPQGNRRPYPGQPQGAYPQGRPQAYGSFRIRETARAALHSPMFFFMALLYTAFLAGSVAAIFMQELNYSQYARIVAAVDVPAQFVSYVDDLFRLELRIAAGDHHEGARMLVRQAANGLPAFLVGQLSHRAGVDHADIRFLAGADLPDTLFRQHLADGRCLGEVQFAA